MVEIEARRGEGWKVSVLLRLTIARCQVLRLHHKLRPDVHGASRLGSVVIHREWRKVRGLIDSSASPAKIDFEVSVEFFWWLTSVSIPSATAATATAFAFPFTL